MSQRQPPTENNQNVGSSSVPRRLTADRVWQALAAGAMMVVVGVVAHFTSEPFLYPGLGPTVFLQAEYPFHKYSSFRDTFVGHVIGVLAGLVSVFLLSANGTQSVESGFHLPPIRIATAALTVTLVILLQIFVRVSNPPSAGTGLLFALGYFAPTLTDAALVLGGVLILAGFGALNRLALSRNEERRTTATQRVELRNESDRPVPEHRGRD